MKIIKTVSLILILALTAYSPAYSLQPLKSTQQKQKPAIPEDIGLPTAHTSPKKITNYSNPADENTVTGKRLMYQSTQKNYDKAGVNDGNSDADNAINEIINATTHGMYDMMKYDPSRY